MTLNPQEQINQLHRLKKAIGALRSIAYGEAHSWPNCSAREVAKQGLIDCGGEKNLAETDPTDAATPIPCESEAGANLHMGDARSSGQTTVAPTNLPSDAAKLITEKLASRIQSWRQIGYRRTSFVEANDYFEFILTELGYWRDASTRKDEHCVEMGSKTGFTKEVTSPAKPDTATPRDEHKLDYAGRDIYNEEGELVRKSLWPQDEVDILAQFLIDCGGIKNWGEINQFGYFKEIAEDIITFLKPSKAPQDEVVERMRLLANEARGHLLERPCNKTQCNIKLLRIVQMGFTKEEAIAAYTASAKSAWQDISTAPKDDENKRKKMRHINVAINDLIVFGSLNAKDSTKLHNIRMDLVSIIIQPPAPPIAETHGEGK